MNILDQYSLGMVFLLAVFFQIVFIEIGYRLGSWKKHKQNKAQMAQVRAIMGASLGLLAFMLAVSFSMAQKHFEERTAAYMLEVSAIDSAYRGADLIGDEGRDSAQELLRDFARLRLNISQAASLNKMTDVVNMIRKSEHIHDQLWSIAERATDTDTNGRSSGIFAQSVLAMIDAHDARLQSALFNRISPIIWGTLFMMALLSMIVMGYQAGLTGTRSSIATWTLAVTFSVVMALVTDLDRPNMTLFNLNQDLMVEMLNRMEGGEAWDLSVHKS